MATRMETIPAELHRPRALLWLRSSCVVVAFFVLLEILRVTTGPNWHAVYDGSIYRAAHLSSQEIAAVAERFGIQTIINLRNNCTWESWYQDETQAVLQCDLKRVDLNFSATQYPAPQELQKLYQALETAPRPIYIHCRRGADRTGLASVFAALFEGDTAITVDQAMRQLSLKKGHAGLGRVEVMKEVAEMYRQWLAEIQQPHSRATLRQWIFDIYRPGFCWAQIELLNPPKVWSVDEPQLIQVRLHNRSKETWQFHAASNIGIHLRGYIEPVEATPPPWANPFDFKPLRKALSAGFLNVKVQPQESIDLDVAIPALKKAGKYTLYLDIYDEAKGCFGETVGSPPWKSTVEITSAPVAQR